VTAGTGRFGAGPGQPFTNGTVILFEKGDSVSVCTDDGPAGFLLISGLPLNEPVAWYGPIVMNTQEELELAFEEYGKGTFIKRTR
jgi:quercetin 2,3-dioxygenase